MLLRGTELELELLGIRERLSWSGKAYGKGIPRYVLPSSGLCSEEKSVLLLKMGDEIKGKDFRVHSFLYWKKQDLYQQISHLS